MTRPPGPRSGSPRDWQPDPAEELAPVDALLMHADADPRQRSSLIGLCVLERTPDWPALEGAVRRMIRSVPRLRQRVVSPLLPVSRPHWVVDPDFDLAYHLRHVRIPEPGGFAQLMGLTDLAAMAPLDPARPLWELTLVEGLRPKGAAPGAPEQAALLWKFSHALGDGVGVLQIALALFDLEPHPPAQALEAPVVVASEAKSRAALLLDRLVELPVDLTTDALRSSAWAAGAAARMMTDPRGSIGGVVSFVRSLQRLVTPPAAPPSPALRHRGTKRRLIVHEVPLERLKQAGRHAGATVNDAYLAAVLGAMRRYHEALGVPVDRMPMAVPVYGSPGSATGLTAARANAAGGNHFSAVRFSAPVSEDDPAARMSEVHTLVARGRAEPALGATDAIARVFARTPQVLLAEISRQQGQLDVQASNVAGFPAQVYLAGTAVGGMFSFGPAPGVAVMFVLVSYNGTCGIGVTLDETAIADADLFARCVAEGFDEVLRLADLPAASISQSAPKRKPRSRPGVVGSRSGAHGSRAGLNGSGAG